MSTEAPPSYDEVVKGLEQKFQNVKPTDLRYVHDVLEQLPASHKNVLAEYQEKVRTTAALKLMTPIQQENMGNAVIDAAHTQFAAESIKKSADDATKAILAVEKSFSDLLVKLSGIDTKWPDAKPTEGAFAPRLTVLMNNFRSIVRKSRNIAVAIAVYGEAFDTLIAPLVTDNDLSKAVKLQKVQSFISDANEHKIASAEINADYQKLKSDMAVVVGSFSGWATGKEGTIDKELETLRSDIVDLSKQIQDRRIALYAIGGAAAASLPITGVLAALCGPAAPAFVIIGAIFAGVTAITAVTLTAVINSLQGQVDAKNSQIKQREALKKEITKTRQDLVDLGKATLSEFKENVDVLAAFWMAAEAEAKNAEQWLKNGEKVVEMPTYLKKATDPAITIYKQVAKGLNEYAKGIDNSKIVST